MWSLPLLRQCWNQKWLRLSEQQTPIIKWNLGGLMCDVALSTGCARRVVELGVSSTSAARGVQLVGKAGLIARVEFYAAAFTGDSNFQYA